MDKKILVVGSGGREHAIVDALSRSKKVDKIYCAPGNAGIAVQAECVPIKDTEVEKLRDFALENGIDLTVVGPEVSLAAGIADVFRAAGLRIFGPSKAAATIESSKDFAKGLMAKYGVPTAAYQTFSEYEPAWEYVREGSFPVVLKYDGLAAGKGVVIAADKAEAEAALKDMLLDDRFGKGRVVVEEFLTGPEFSFMCFVDGADVHPMVLSQDHKRAYEGDKGPNTGGMGAYSPVPIITDADVDYALEKIMKPVAAGMVAEGCPFKGVLYGGLMKTPDGVKVIEFNCRFGDPETEVVLPRLETDIYDVFSAIADGTPVPELKWSEKVTMGFVMASKGYPGSYEKGYEIKGLEALASNPDIKVYQMGTARKDGKLVTSGGRVLMVVASGESLKAARDKALAAVESISCENLFWRRDIGWRVLECESSQAKRKIISGKELSAKLKAEMAARVATFPEKYGRVPHLVVILVGEDPGSVSYVTGKAKACEVTGIKNTTIRRPADISEEELLGLIRELNEDDSVDGILVQLPLPKHISEAKVIATISQEKDVDGFHPLNVAALWQKQQCITACTPKGIIRLLDEAGVEIAGKRAVVIGRSNIVGLPVAKLLLDRNATVTIAHSRTADLPSVTRQAEILVVAIGRPKFVTADMVSEGAVVIDVGVNRDPQTGKLCGDVDFNAVELKASVITPVPGGVGPMTICCLMENTIECFLRRI